MEVISTDRAAQSRSPVSQAVRWDGLLFVSGQLPRDPATGKLVSGGMKHQARQVMENIGAILGEGGGAFDSIVRVDCIVTDLGMMKEFNDVYREYFPEAFPARMAYEVSRIAGGALVEVAVIAAVRGE